MPISNGPTGHNLRSHHHEQPAIVTGNLTRTPQLSHTSDGTPVVNLTLAENSRRLLEGEWVDGPTTYWDIVCFGPQAEHITGSLTKGARVIAVGVFRADEILERLAACVVPGAGR